MISTYLQIIGNLQYDIFCSQLWNQFRVKILCGTGKVQDRVNCPSTRIYVLTFAVQTQLQSKSKVQSKQNLETQTQ